MGAMATGLNARAYDLSAVAAAAKTPPPPPGASFVAEVSDASLEAFLQLSAKHPVVLELYSPRAHGQTLSDTLRELANAAAGAYLLGRVNVDLFPQIAQALGVQAVPFVIGVVAGQMLPLFQGTRSKEDAQAVLGELLNAAAQAGVVGRAAPVSIDENAGPDPRFEAADAALEAGDYAKAVAEFDRLLALTPSDVEAKAGRAQASLLLRLQAVADPAQALDAAAASPDDADAQLVAADVEIFQGRSAEAFARLIETIRRTAGAQREAVRVRVLELFETVGPADPSVAAARRELMTALF